MPDDETWQPDEQQRRRIAEARAARARRAAVPADERRVVDNPAKYGFAVGFDSSGPPFPLTEPGSDAPPEDVPPPDGEPADR